ncbi:MAG TPA: isochorismatase family protein [Chloroflexota bacterium]|nr:isochorismatase family protein [Chloroflexota bacterium]
MNSRPWDRFLTENDKAHLAASKHVPIGFGERPVLLLIDIYRGVMGDEPQELMEGIKTWPGHTGMAGWNAIPHVQRLLAAAREAGIPVIHATGNPGIPHWSDRREALRGRPTDPAAVARQRRRFDIIDEVAPIDGEIVIRKSSPSAFFGTILAAHLNYVGADTVIVGGESTSGCVRASVVDGCTYRFRMAVVEECVWDRHEACHAINLFDMNQKYADVVSVDETVDWLRSWRARQGSAEAELALAGSR